MPRLRISLLGAVQVATDRASAGGPAYDKVRALLGYLLVEPQRAHRREFLAELLWPDQPGGKGRHSLRQALVTLRQMLGDADEDAPLFLATRDSLQIHADADYSLDLHAFSTHLDSVLACSCSERHPCSACVYHLEEAVTLYRGDFMAGLSVDASVEFDSWLLEVREGLRLRALDALSRLCEARMHEGAYLQAGDLARRQLAMDPCREQAHRQVMLALYLNGDRRAALEQFRQCESVLLTELGVEPEPETVALRDSIRHQTLDLRRARGPSVRLPPQATPFIGREREMAEIESLLGRPDCRLLTLAGPGGSGKTRLAIEAASHVSASFDDGVAFVPLSGVHAPGSLSSAIAGAVFPTGTHNADANDALAGFLRDRRMLLVLDNFEHLVSAAEVVSGLLERAPALRVIVTSRQRLHLYEEHVIDLDGLLHTAGRQPEHVLDTDAARLFIESARRASSRFSVQPEDVLAVDRICRLVGGMPLAIELAAASTPVLSCTEIAAEIGHNLDILASSIRNVPDRHRSIRAVFDRSWDLLSANERQVFLRLAIFRGGFDRRAAEYVAGADLSILSSLVNKSLVRRAGRDRYEVHELLRQYGDARLTGTPDVRRLTSERHSEYYCSRLAELESALCGHGQEEALVELTSEIENLRIAWRWAADHRRADLLLKAGHGLWVFLEVSSRYLDAQTLFGQAAEQMRRLHAGAPDSEAARLAAASMLVRHGSVYCRLGDNHLGEVLVSEGCAIARELNAAEVLGLGLNFMGMFAIERSDNVQAESYLRESIACFKAVGDRWGEAYSTNDLGMVTFKRGDVAEAERLQRLAIDMFSRLGDKRGMAFALHNQGVIAAGQGRYEEARQSLQDALEIRRSLRYSWAISTTLTQLGIVAEAIGDPDGARLSLIQALQEASEVHSVPAILAALAEIAVVIVQPSSPERARDLLVAVRRHPAAGGSLGARVDELLNEVGARAGEPAGVHLGGSSIERFTREILVGGVLAGSR